MSQTWGGEMDSLPKTGKAYSESGACFAWKGFRCHGVVGPRVCGEGTVAPGLRYWRSSAVWSQLDPLSQNAIWDGMASKQATPTTVRREMGANSDQRTEVSSQKLKGAPFQRFSRST